MDKELKIYGGSRARLRANRKNSSAPTAREQRVYARELRRALKGKKNPQVLVWGATPELRDMAIQQGAKCLAVDWSWDTLMALDKCMQYSGSEHNLMMRCSWDKMSVYLEPNSFNAILGDISLNNVYAADQEKMIKDAWRLLKPGGKIITRHSVFVPGRKITYAQWQKGYNQGKYNWLSVIWPLALYLGSAYDRKTGKLDFFKVFQEYYKAARRGEARLRPIDRKRMDNTAAYGNKVVHITMTPAKFARMVKPYFTIERIIGNPEFIFPDSVAIYVLRKNKHYHAM